MAGGLAESEDLATREDEFAVLEVPQVVKVHSQKVKSYYGGFLYVRHIPTARTLTMLAVTIWRWAHLEALGLFINNCGGRLEHLRIVLGMLYLDPDPFLEEEQKAWELINLSSCCKLETLFYAPSLVRPEDENDGSPCCESHCSLHGLVSVTGGVTTIGPYFVSGLCEHPYWRNCD
ncbi:unnamed protein product [Somion occarium]|uniref:Uncharacterized protein n=1 Tax=Somion occarium TaxID=3059160 RepID=A0ABP1CEV5_9APHY